ncbi:MAG: serine protease [Bacteroidales bacterium]|nr:serine protease [Bacteroidales bacterium]
MDTIMEMYGALSPEMKFYWTIAIVASLIFAIQTLLTFIGIDHTDVDFDFTGDVDASAGHTLDTGGTMQLFTIRNIVNFLLGLGWGGVCWSAVVENKVALTILSIVTGVVFVVVFLFILKGLMKLESNGAYQMEDCVGNVCDVYLRIPAERGGQGKVQVSLNGSVHEFAAVTDGEMLPSGTKVKIESLVDRHTVLVSKA